MCELPYSGVAGNPTHGFDVIDNLFGNYAGDDGGGDSVGESIRDEHESDGRDDETGYENEGPGDDTAATILVYNALWCMSDDDFNSDLDDNFDTTSVLLDTHGDDDDMYKWGEPAGRDPHMWGEITLTGAPEHLNGEPLIGARLNFECCWAGDDGYVDAYEFEIDIEGELHGLPLDHIRNHPECVRFSEPWSYPPADIVLRAIDVKRRRDQESLRPI